jgi:hypothetical protein
MRIAKGGYNTYGFTVGLLMLQSRFPRIPGDTGNASSFKYPIRLQVVQDASYERLVLERDPELLQPFVAAAKALEAEGVKAITTNCGFLALFQKEMATAVNVPVFTSSLLLVPMLSSMVGPDKKVGIMTVNGEALGEPHYNGVGWSSKDYPIVIVGMEDEPLFTKVFAEDRLEFNIDHMEADMVNVARRLVTDHPDVGVLLFECTNMPPYAHAVQEAVGLPVFTIFSLIDMVYQSLHWKPFEGYM